MNQIIIFSDKKALIHLWSTFLFPKYQIKSTINIDTVTHADIVIIDSQQITEDNQLVTLFSKKGFQLLIFGSNWPEKSQIKALASGASGYCDESIEPKVLLQAIEQILKGDIWIQRLLVPKVIGSLIQMKAAELNTPSPKILNLLKSLSKREHDVVKMINKGQDNKTIASMLFISERTVKAHLTSIFKKLNVPNRLHLALLLKGVD